MFVIYACRSQRDVEGEKALRETELQQLHKKLAKVEGEIATAENDKKQFDGAVMRVYDREAELRWVPWGLNICLLVILCALDHKFSRRGPIRFIRRGPYQIY